MAWTGRTGTIFVDEAGVLLHLPSGMRFPAQIRGFEREAEPRVYDLAGYDVSVGYNRDADPPSDGKTALTVYVYPASLGADRHEQELDGELQKVKAGILRVHPSARLLAEETIAHDGRTSRTPGRRATFVVPEGTGVYLSEIYLFRRGIWHLKYRVSYPQLQPGAGMADVAALVEALGCPHGA
jgi:hypothetical protein